MRTTLVPLCAGTLVGVTLLAGCEDSSARSRAEIQIRITEASRSLEVAARTAASADDATATDGRRQLDEIIMGMSSLREADNGQQVAANMLASSASRRLAGLDLHKAETLESENRRACTLLHSQIDAAMRLEALAAGVANVSTTAERDLLAGERESAQQQLHVFSARLAELDGPIAEREQLNEDDARQATRLEDEAVVLRRQAAEWGHADGLATFEEALRLERQADRHEYQIAWRESDLQYELRPEHAYANAQVTHLQTKITAIDSTEMALDRFEELDREQVQDTRELVADYKQRIARALAEVIDVAEGDLTVAYDEAASHLEQAVSTARQATNKSARGEADAARLALVRSLNQQGLLFVRKARGLNVRASVLERVAAAGGSLGSVADSQTRLTAVREAESVAIEQARTHITEAQDQLQQVKSGAAQMQAFRDTVAASLATLTVAVAPDAVRRPTSSAAAPSTPASSDGTSGFGTPEDLLDAMRTGPADAASMTRLLDAFYVTTPAARTQLAMQRKALGPVTDFFAAITEKFGDVGQLGAGLGGATGSITMSDAQVVDRTEDRVTVSFSGGPGGMPRQLDLVQMDGGWVVEADPMFPDLPPAAQQQAEKMSATVVQLFTDLADRVRSGEFSTADEVVQTLMGEMMGAMRGAGGMPRGGP